MQLGATRLHTDSSAAKSYASRRGIGKIRHTAVKQLWLQDLVCRCQIVLMKISGTENPADAMTKYHRAEDMVKMCGALNVEIV